MHSLYRKLIFKIIYEKERLRSKYLIFKYNLNPDISIDKTVFISKNVKIACEWGGKISIGANTKILDGVILLTYGNNIEIGHDCSINPYTIIYGQGGTKIGNYVIIAGHNMIVSQNHNFENGKVIKNSGSTEKGIVIEDNVWIAHGCSILDGIRIASGTVVAAGTVLNKSTEENSVWGGVPARKIKSY